MHYSKENGKRHTKSCHLLVIFQNLQDVSVLPSVKKSCVLKLSCDQPVTIRENEAAIVEAAFREGYIQVQNPKRNGKK